MRVGDLKWEMKGWKNDYKNAQRIDGEERENRNGNHFQSLHCCEVVDAPLRLISRKC